MLLYFLISKQHFFVYKRSKQNYMRGYVKIPRSIYCKLCKECGSRPVIAQVSDIGYVVKCPNNHYQTMPGLIDIEDWNVNNTITLSSVDYDFKLNDGFMKLPVV